MAITWGCSKRHPENLGSSRCYQGAKFHSGLTFFDINLVMGYWLFGKLQISEDEIMFLTGGDDPYDDKVVLTKLFHPNLKLLIVIEGPNGSRYYTKVIFVNLIWLLDYLNWYQFASFIFRIFMGKLVVLRWSVDTTGAGDAFVGGLLLNLAKNTQLFKVKHLNKLAEKIIFWIYWFLKDLCHASFYD